VTVGDWAILPLVALPVLALTGLGFLTRSFVDGGGNHWPLWLLVVALAAGVWLYFFFTWPEWARELSALEDFEAAA
jgi:hypothetical protein